MRKENDLRTISQCQSQGNSDRGKYDFIEEYVIRSDLNAPFNDSSHLRFYPKFLMKSPVDFTDQSPEDSAFIFNTVEMYVHTGRLNHFVIL